jgi:hypothetical protein
MASVVISGDTSGTVTLQAPAVAGSTVLALPSTSGNVVAVASGSAIPATQGGTGLISSGTSGNVLTSDGTTWQSSTNQYIGVGQTWTLFTTTTRAYGTTYTNSTGKPITVVHAWGRNESATISINGVSLWVLSHDSNNNSMSCITFVVPNGQTYGISGTYSSDSVNAASYWNELR